MNSAHNLRGLVALIFYSLALLSLVALLLDEILKYLIHSLESSDMIKQNALHRLLLIFGCKLSSITLCSISSIDAMYASYSAAVII